MNTNASLHSRHTNMVANLAKPGIEIKESTNLFRIDTIHALARLQLNMSQRLAQLTDIGCYLPDRSGDCVSSLDSETEKLNDPAYYHEMHMLLGASGELGELLGAVKKTFIYGKELDRENCVEEIGDFLFYIRGSSIVWQEIMIYKPYRTILTALDITTEECLEANIKKLEKRYWKGVYSDEAAVHRADKIVRGGADLQNPS